MEEIINKVIDIDKRATEIISSVEEQEKNIELYIEEELKAKQERIIMETKIMLSEKRKDYDYEIKSKREKIQKELDIELQKLEENYEDQRKLLVENAYNTIINS